ncbi:undecaprenyl-phosphate galactose phosphotransferase WbaP [Marinobacter sp. F4216]|uniref:undecaprenyl-phosphate galactose phosphotransferase WbaP n=1 Tax=Marinobacter sp. F4216 TaxID=2874281 RepID=UPI001CBB6938|nr:undecaprenyl-phosphate galactose phosphotransferase WbaP [Marinobacter sp. F4216]MBZ2168435.1 undecaprenyl-phosphate galactose phosphotransferase WbaP [Marinobacter sp. F4216]
MLLVEQKENLQSNESDESFAEFDISNRQPGQRRFFQSAGLLSSEVIGLSAAYSVATQVIFAGGLYDLSLLLLSVCLFVIFQIRKSQYTRRKPFWDQIYHFLEVCFLLALLTAAIPNLTGQDSSRVWVIWLIGSITLPVARFLAIKTMALLDLWERPTVIVGDGPNAVETAKALMQDKTLGYRVIGFLSAGPSRDPKIRIGKRNYPVAHLGQHPENTLEALNYPHVVIALERGGLDRMQYYFDKLNLFYRRLSVVPALRGVPLFGMDVDSFFSHEVMMLNVRNNLHRPMSRLAKRLFDVFGSLLLLIVLAPAFFVLWFLVRKTGKQVFFGHERIGMAGRSFKCYKFRSMVVNAQDVLEELLENDPEARDEWNREFKLKNDPRVTGVGNFLRRTSLDELPQLWNVLKGDMSLVGPRPVVAEEIEKYGEKTGHYLLAKPGMTGLWQVSGRNDVDYDSRIYLDSWYVKNWSLWSDIVILFRTVRVVLGRDGAY